MNDASALPMNQFNGVLKNFSPRYLPANAQVEPFSYASALPKSVLAIADLKKVSVEYCARVLRQNAKDLYGF